MVCRESGRRSLTVGKAVEQEELRGGILWDSSNDVNWLLTLRKATATAMALRIAYLDERAGLFLGGEEKSQFVKS